MPAKTVSAFPDLTLGTVQLGLPYGKISASEPADAATASRFLQAAWDGGVRCLDTAGNYGTSERLIGSWLKDRTSRPAIVSKLPAYPADATPDPAGFVEQYMAQSLSDLGVESLDAYLMHRPSDIRIDGLVDAMAQTVRKGQARAWGLSIYTEEEFRIALTLPGLSVLQAPVSIFDTRLIRSGALDAATRAGATVFARSVFLQGAMFIDPDKVPADLSGLEPALRQLRALSQSHDIPPGALALKTVMSLNTVASTVVGTATLPQLKEIIAWSRINIPDDALQSALLIGDKVHADLVDPRNWPTSVS